VLAQIERDDPSDVIALGALPYDTNQAASLVVPHQVRLVTTDGERRLIEVSAEGTPVEAPPKEKSPSAAAGSNPLCVTTRSVQHPQAWMDLVQQATERIRAGELTKVVLARALDVESDVDFDAELIWRRLDAQHPGSYRFAMDGFVGASPELLVSRRGSTVRAHPMAGTTPRTGDPDLDQRRAGELLASQKNQTEHMITIDAVMDALLDSCSYLDSEPSPSVVAAGPVQHLATLVEGRLSAPEPDVLQLVAALHPTPAVGGYPRDVADSVRQELETVPRGLYAGPVGWVDAAGDGAFAVGIRSVQIENNRARLFAGVGVVADSDPEAELAETRAKAQTLLNVLVRL
jgi:menaquinone-specific isochorismate synthase